MDRMEPLILGLPKSRTEHICHKEVLVFGEDCGDISQLLYLFLTVYNMIYLAKKIGDFAQSKTTRRGEWVSLSGV